ncbi:MAG: SulP family inorganic anion transporter [Gammaproteobacteria bacterium]|nr:SulP family inorganic anion transporter [Gammaproteobacteria bacterium]
MCTIFPFLQWVPLLNRRNVKADLIAGIIAGILILPQAIALATLAGMPPEYGFYTAIFPVIVLGVFGASWHALAGPNTAVALLTISILQIYASPFTPDYIAYVITLTFMVGVLQLLFGVLRLGVIFNYFSHTVMVALVSGVGIIIIVQQLGIFFGLTVNVGEPIEDTLYQLAHSLYLSNWYEALVGFVTVLSGILVKKYSRFPPMIAAVVIGMLAGVAVDAAVGSAVANIDKLGYMSLSLTPFSAPDFTQENFAIAQQGLFTGAFAIAFLALMQSAVIARSMAVRSGQSVDMNQEVTGHALSNIVGSFLSCFVSCGSFNRSAANIDAGAVTPLTGLISAAVLALLVFFATDIIAAMPMSTMAGVLILVGWGLIKPGDIKKLLLLSRESRYIFLLVSGTTIYGGVQNGVFLGMLLSVAIYLRRVSKPEIECVTGKKARQYYPLGLDSGNVLQVSGSLFFGSVPALEKALAKMADMDNRRENLIILGQHIQNLDEAGVNVFVQEAKRREANKKRLVLLLESRKLYDTELKQHGFTLVPWHGDIYCCYI